MCATPSSVGRDLMAVYVHASNHLPFNQTILICVQTGQQLLQHNKSKLANLRVILCHSFAYSSPVSSNGYLLRSPVTVRYCTVTQYIAAAIYSKFILSKLLLRPFLS